MKLTSRVTLCLMAAVMVLASSCSQGNNANPKKCQQDYTYDWRGLLPGPGEAGYDAELALVAARRDRQFHIFHTLPTGANAEISISYSKTAERQAIEDFLLNEDGWDFEASSGYKVTDIIDSWWKVAGAYGGVAIAADAFRYGVMRDQCYPAAEVERARQHLLVGLEALHMAVAITGIEGGIVRGFANKNYPGAPGPDHLVDLFDEHGDPLPAEKTNGTWRADNSGDYPDFVWEDSCSRDMLIGWAVAFGGAWEVIENDPAIADQVKETMRADARAVVGNLKTVQPNGYDLELLDADGRTTYHGYLNENNLDRTYIDGVRNGFHTIMALGIVGALADVADDSAIDRWLYDELIDDREFAVIAHDGVTLVNMEEVTNFSNYNMAFEGAWLALRHIRDDSAARADILQALEVQLYNTPGKRFQPFEQGQTFFDLTYAAGKCDASSAWGCKSEPDQAAIDRAIQTLREFPAPPFWEFFRENCDQSEIDSGHCIADDGETELTVLGEVGRNGDLITAEPLPMRLRGPSNYYWRSNPYKPNGGSENAPGMFAGPDFRIGYWMARWIRRPAATGGD